MPEGTTINPLDQRPAKLPVFRFLLIGVLLGALAVAAWFTLRPEGEVAAENWISYQSAEGRFSADFPAEPEVSTREMEGSEDKLNLVTAALRSRVYSVAYSDYLQAELTTFGPDALLDYAMTAGTEAMEGKITRSDKITLGDNPGREFWADVPGGVAHYRLFLVGRRMYRVAVIHSPGFKANHEKFFGSFAVK